MKKNLLILFCALTLCSLLLVANVKTTEAHAPGYDFAEYSSIVKPTIDGQWTTPDEWADGQRIDINENACFLTKTTFSSGTWKEFLVEIFNDTTNDAGDVWEICIDQYYDGGTQQGIDDIRVEVFSDRVNVYEGTASGTWSRNGGLDDATMIQFAVSLSSSPLHAEAHMILEITMDWENWAIYDPTPPYGFRIEEANAYSGTSMSWPPDAQRDVPDQWGTMTSYTGTSIPEGFSILVIVLLSSAVAIVGFSYLRKHPKTKTLTTIKP